MRATFKKIVRILFPKKWNKAKVKGWVYKHCEYIAAQFYQKYGATFIENIIPQNLYSLLADWQFVYCIEDRIAVKYHLDKVFKTFTVISPFGYDLVSVRNELIKKTANIQEELNEDNDSHDGIIGSVRNKTSIGCSFAVAPSMKSRSTSYHNVSNVYWRGSGWVRDITETPSERASNVKNGNRIQRSTPISASYAKASDMRGLGVLDSSGRLVFIDKKSDAWIEDKNN